MSALKYSYHEERGEFHGYVEDEMGNVIFEMHYPEFYEDDETGELLESSTIFEDGFMKHADDTEGLRKYLVDMRLINEDDEVIHEDDFKSQYNDGGLTSGAYGHGTTLLEEGGEMDIEEEDKEENEIEEHLQSISDDTGIPVDVLRSYADEIGTDYMDLTNDIPYNGAFGTQEDFAEHLVDNGLITDLSNYLYMTDLDIRILAGEEADARLDGMDDEDIADLAGKSDEYEELKDDLERLEELNDEIEVLESDIKARRDAFDHENATEEERDDFDDSQKSDEEELEQAKEQKELLDNKIEWSSIEDFIDDIRDDALSNVNDEITEELEKDAVGYFENLGYSQKDLANHSLFSIDYDKLADDVSYDYIFIEGEDGDYHIFNNYADGGAIPEGYHQMPDGTIMPDSAHLEHGGGVAEGNLHMLKNQAEQFEHHANELQEALKKNPRVDAWVVAKAERAATDLSDITHYLEGLNHEHHGDGEDVIKMDVPLFIRSQEYAREDAKSDADLHEFADNAIDLSQSGETLEMDDYNKLVPNYMAKGGETRYKLKGNNFGQQIENGQKFKELIARVFKNQSGDTKYPENFIKGVAYTSTIVKKDGSNFLKNHSYKGTFTKFEFLDDKDFLEALKYLNRPPIKSLKFEDGGEMAKGGVLASSSSKEGIEKLISEYYYGSKITLTKVGNAYQVSNAKGKITGVKVIEKNGRYQFVSDTKMMARGGVNFGASFEKFKKQVLPINIETRSEVDANTILKYADLQNVPATLKSIGDLFVVILDKPLEIRDSMEGRIKELLKGNSYAKGGKFKVDSTYTHFAVGKKDGKIITGWEYKDLDKEDIKRFTDMDLKDMDFNPKDFRILTTRFLKSQGIDPFDWSNWKKTSEFAKGGATDDLLDFDIPNWAMSAIVNGDTSGLEDEDIQKIDAFEKKLIKNYGNANLMLGDVDGKDDLGFRYKNDIDGNLGADCTRMYLRPTKDYAKGGDVYDDIWEAIKVSNNKVDIVANSLKRAGYNVGKITYINTFEDAYIELNDKIGIGVEAFGQMYVSIKNDDRTISMYDAGKNFLSLISKLKSLKIEPNYAKGGMVEYVLYGTKVGKKDWQEEVLAVRPYKFEITPELEKVTKKDGYNRLRIAKIDLSTPPDFRKIVKKSTGGEMEGGEYAKGGATFDDKVKAISSSLTGKEVPKRLRKDYGKKYNKKEALEAARRIAGSMRAKEMKKGKK